jgi:ribosome production factor 1
VAHIRNKEKRGEILARARRQKRKEKEARREARKEAGLPTPKQKTIESEREADPTMAAGSDEELEWDEASDEFAARRGGARGEPRTLVTTGRRGTKLAWRFAGELLDIFPNSTFRKRQGFPMKKVVEAAVAAGFTTLVTVNEDRKRVNGLLVTHLPEGPTAHFRLSNLRLRKDIQGHGRAIRTDRPELVLNRFDTRVGRRMGRFFGAMFHEEPDQKTRQVATFHNQRDYVFFRHHRYIFEARDVRAKKGQPAGQQEVVARLQELGPRFTLKLRSIQLGAFDSKHAEYEFISAPHRQTARRRFIL